MAFKIQWVEKMAMAVAFSWRLALMPASACCFAGCVIPVGKEAGIRQTEPNLQRRPVFASAALGRVNSITTVSLNGEPRIAVGGSRGTAFLSQSYVPDRFVAFVDAGLRTTVPIDVDGDGNLEYMDRGGGWSPVKLLDADGRLLWAFPKKDQNVNAANQMAAGDLDGDGVLDFVVGMNAGSGIYALAKDGSVKWHHDASNVFAVEIVDLNGDGHPEVVHVDGQHVVIRDAQGTEMRRFQFPVSALRPLVWKLDAERPLIVGRKEGQLHWFDPFGNPVSSVTLARGRGTRLVAPVRLGGQLHYAAANYVPYAYETGYLYLYDARGRMLHEEVFTGRVNALAALPDPKRPDSEILLVGVGAQVIEYRKD
jgi:hypothetical protein